ncbi:MAG: glycosyltransferase family 4 protein [Sphaerospermopsis sp. SIO1G1]|nr:glycosyltransferase family 4 protein [Sphaerospermopsis sp. SIO1G1]
MKHPERMSVLMVGASLEQNGGIATVEKLILKYIPEEIDIRHITSHDEGSVLHRIIVFIYALMKIVSQLLFQKVDIVYIHMSDGGSIIRKAFVSLIASLFRKAFIVHTHGAEFHVSYSRIPKLCKYILNQIFQQCQYFIVLSHAWQDYYISNLGLPKEKVLILPNPTELPDKVPLRSNTEKVNFLFCGRVGMRKGTFDLIKAFANLPQEILKTSYITIAGDGEIQEALVLVKELNLSNHINLVGWVNSDDRNNLLANSDVFILPSYNEGLPMAILEAMGWGLPIISTPVGGIPELVINHQNGLIVTPGNIKELSAAMALLIQDEQLRISLGTVARTNVEPYDINHYCCQLVEIYSSLAKFVKVEELHES